MSARVHVKEVAKVAKRRFRDGSGVMAVLCVGLAAGPTAQAQVPQPQGPEATVTLPPWRHQALDLQWRGVAAHPADPRPVQVTLQRYASAWQPGVAPLPDTLSVAVYVHAGPRTQVGWQQDGVAVTRMPGQMALRASDPLADLRLGALAKFSLGSQSSISLRPRKGGMRLYLQAQW